MTTGHIPPAGLPPTIKKRSERGLRPILQAVVGSTLPTDTARTEPPRQGVGAYLDRRSAKTVSPSAVERKAKREAALKLHPDINPARIDDDGNVWPYCYQDTSRLVLCCDCKHFSDDACSRGKQCSLQAVGERAEIRRWLVPTPGNGYQCFSPLVSPTFGRVSV